MDGRHASKNVVLIMPLCSTASGGVGVRGSHMCKAKSTYWVVCCAGGTSVKSREISQDRSGKWLRELIADF